MKRAISSQSICQKIINTKPETKTPRIDILTAGLYFNYQGAKLSERAVKLNDKIIL